MLRRQISYLIVPIFDFELRLFMPLFGFADMQLFDAD